MSTMNPKRKRKKRSSSEKAPVADATSPFELAQTAIALCQLHKKERQCYDLQPAHYFPAAKQLLDEAKSYLNDLANDRKEFTANAMIIMGWGNPEDYARAGKPIPFEVLLRRHDDSKLDGNNKSKKHRTWVGAITTQNGLEKAIRRYFKRSEATRLIGANAITEAERQQLLKAQKHARQHGV